MESVYAPLKYDGKRKQSDTDMIMIKKESIQPNATGGLKRPTYKTKPRKQSENLGYLPEGGMHNIGGNENNSTVPK